MLVFKIILCTPVYRIEKNRTEPLFSSIYINKIQKALLIHGTYQILHLYTVMEIWLVRCSLDWNDDRYKDKINTEARYLQYIITFTCSISRGECDNVPSDTLYNSTYNSFAFTSHIHCYNVRN